MEYNTQKAPVRMKAYGREVQLMVEHALTLSDRAERTAYAARIVDTMRIVSRQPADSREVNEKLWNHLAQLTDYALDIDWPVEVDRAPAAAQAERLTYPTHRLRFRHYGHLLQTWMNRAPDSCAIWPLACNSTSPKCEAERPKSNAWPRTSTSAPKGASPLPR